jgi:hypothetical protein
MRRVLILALAGGCQGSAEGGSVPHAPRTPDETNEEATVSPSANITARAPRLPGAHSEAFYCTDIDNHGASSSSCYRDPNSCVSGRENWTTQGATADPCVDQEFAFCLTYVEADGRKSESCSATRNDCLQFQDFLENHSAVARATSKCIAEPFDPQTDKEKRANWWCASEPTGHDFGVCSRRPDDCRKGSARLKYGKCEPQAKAACHVATDLLQSETTFMCAPTFAACKESVRYLRAEKRDDWSVGECAAHE